LEVDKISITPNPAQSNSYVKVILGQNQLLTRVTYNLYTIDGAKLTTGNLEDGLMFIPNFSPGIYIVEIDSGSEKHIDKFIVH